MPSPSYRSTFGDKRTLIENERLKNDNEIIAPSKNFTSVALTKELDAKDRENEALRRELTLVEDRYEREITTLRL